MKQQHDSLSRRQHELQEHSHIITELTAEGYTVLREEGVLEAVKLLDAAATVAVARGWLLHGGQVVTGYSLREALEEYESPRSKTARLVRRGKAKQEQDEDEDEEEAKRQQQQDEEEEEEEEEAKRQQQEAFHPIASLLTDPMAVLGVFFFGEGDRSLTREEADEFVGAAAMEAELGEQQGEGSTKARQKRNSQASIDMDELLSKVMAGKKDPMDGLVENVKEEEDERSPAKKKKNTEDEGAAASHQKTPTKPEAKPESKPNPEPKRPAACCVVC